MLSVSKSEAFYKLIEWVIESTCRFVLKIVFGFFGLSPNGNWGWMHWLVFIVFVGLLLFLVALATGRFMEKHKQ